MNSSGASEITCKHGPTECVGNKQQLWYILLSSFLVMGLSQLTSSFQKYHPEKILKFISCLNKSPSKIGTSLSHALHCAEKVKVRDYTTVIQPCAETSEGADMLRQCADRCNELKTHVSATIRVGGKAVCVRDGGEWKNCKSVISLGGGDVALGLQKTIEKEWSKANSKGLNWQVDKRN